MHIMDTGSRHAPTPPTTTASLASPTGVPTPGSAGPQGASNDSAADFAAALVLHDLCLVRGRRTLFSGLCLAAQPGELLRVQGANGAGKTSLLRIVCGLLTPTRGEVRWRGQHIATLREEYALQLVYLGHAAALKDELSALENLQAACALAGHATQRHEALAALAAAGLRGREHVPARILSQGQRRRAGLARLVLAANAPLWVLDEPFNALDTDACAWLLGHVAGHLGRGGIVVLTSHQAVALPATLAQRVVDL